MMMLPSLVSSTFGRIAASAVIAPSLQGASAVAQALGVVGLCSGCAVGMGATDRFLRLDSVEREDTTVTAVASTFLRALLVPSLLEEVMWRVVLQPPGMKWGQILVINAAFSLYHVLGSAQLAERFNGHVGATAVFRDPAFLSLAFVLGSACSFAYIKAGYALWAPVLVHAVPVTIWLSLMGGESALLTRGGLPTRSISLPRQDEYQQGYQWSEGNNASNGSSKDNRQ